MHAFYCLLLAGLWDEGSNLFSENRTCSPLGPEVIQLDFEHISRLAPRFPKQLLQRLRALGRLASKHGVNVHRYGGIKVGELKGGAWNQETAVDLIGPPEKVNLGRGEMNIHSLSHLPCVASLIGVRDEVE